MDMSIRPAEQSIQQPPAEVSIEQPAAIVEISTTKGVLEIDSSQARRDIGMIGPLESIQNYAEQGRQENLKGIARRVQEGRQVMLSAGKGQQPPAYVQIARNTHGPQPTRIGIKFIPSIGSVKINYTPSKVDINIQARKPQIDVKVNKPLIEYTPGSIENTLVQRPSVEIDVIE